MNKIFGIGMPKTATTSLHNALKMLNYRSIHFVRDRKTVAELRSENYRLSILDRYDAISDAPIPAIFKQLDECWPNSKFILTVRSLDKWIDSCRSAPFNSDKAVPSSNHYRHYYRTLIYGQTTFDESVFARAYQSHNDRVRSYFSGNKALQLLVMDITKGDGWEKLCPFLNVSIPERDFPRSNSRKFDPLTLNPANISHNLKKVMWYCRKRLPQA
ncbi:sulfotransferase family protein [Synechococcus sp. PCC 7336]|uniref:sulfotransferase family protein n=1 Tax=Synechococcus sp. PCC 7336 TaxID=195250 RepID=UPI00034D54B0|nr:sulfotransferase family protein [Synechococcus sp. PCC 7336]